MGTPNLRRCISCGKVAPKGELWRVVRLHGSGEIQIDQGMGRSAYLCPTPSCLQEAQKKRRFNRALRTAVPADLGDRLWTKLRQEKPSPGTGQIEGKSGNKPKG